MSMAALLAEKLAVSLTKLLLKTYLGKAGQTVGDDLVDVAKTQISDYWQSREINRQFERIAERIVKELLPLFEREAIGQEISANAVATELAATLETGTSTEVLLENSLDDASIIAELRRVRPISGALLSEAELGLYDRALERSVRYLVEIAPQLPRFESARAHESLKRLAHLAEGVDETLRTVKRIETAASKAGGDKEEQWYETEYRLAVIRNLDFLELFGADLTTECRRHALSVAYVSLNLETHAGQRASTPLPVEVVLESIRDGAPGLLIRGDAGSGKTTLFRWTAIQAARGHTESARWVLGEVQHLARGFRLLDINRSPLVDAWYSNFRARQLYTGHMTLPDLQAKSADEWAGEPFDICVDFPGSNWRGRIPFLIRLRDCHAGKLPSPEDFPALIAKEIGTPPAAWVLSVLCSNRALVLLDGIDEIPNIHRDSLRRDLASLVKAFPHCRFLVSTRPEAVPPDWLADLGFSEAHINIMSDVDRELFIDRWHEAVADELARMGRPAEGLRRLAQDLKDRLRETPTIRRLASNPLLCAMICALHRDRNQKLPESQADLCEALCQVLLHRRERESGLDLSEFPAAYRRLSYPQKRALVQELAYSMVLNGESVISVELARKKLAQALAFFPGHASDDAPEVCASLVERSGMLREARPGYIDFIHNTFKEFLAGDRVANAGDAGLVAGHIEEPAWQRVAQFAVATPRQEFATDLIERILNDPSEIPFDDRTLRGRATSQGSVREEREHLRQRLALQCRASALFVSPALDARLEALARSLFPPRDMDDAAVLAEGGDAILPYLHYRRRLPAKAAAACVRALRLVGTRGALIALNGYRNDARSSVIAELSQILNPLELSGVRKIILAGKQLPFAISKQVSDLTPLRDLAALTKLDLSNTTVADLSPLSALEQLEILDLQGTAVEDLQPLRQMTKLRRLLLDRTRIADLSPLKGLLKLEVLSLARTEVCDITVLGAFASLWYLDLENASVSDISPLSNLSRLLILHLGGDRVPDLAPLRSMSHLASLHLRCDGDWGVLDIPSLISVRDLTLSGGTLRDISPLAALANLESLNLINIDVPDISSLSRLPRLEKLVIGDCPGIELSPLREMSLKRIWVITPREFDASQIKDIPGMEIHSATKEQRGRRRAKAMSSQAVRPPVVLG